MTVINTNIKSLVSQHALTRNSRALASAMEQLSTGKRINSAADDAAGLAISSRMSAQIKGLDQAVRNANDGISLLQTTEGALIEVTNMLHRMRELAVQAANDTYTAADREYLELEYKQLIQEVARITSDTEWNGMNLLNNADVGSSGNNGSTRTVKFQVGANANQLVTIDLKDFSFDLPAASVPSKFTLDFSEDDMSTATSVKFTLGSETFTTAITAGDLSATPTAAQVAAVADKMRQTVQGTSGFENVQFSTSGTSVEIWDPTRRAFSAFDSLAVSTSLASTAVMVSTSAGTAATESTNPGNTNAIFRGNARINDTSVITRDEAFVAIDRLEKAVDAINQERAAMGAVMNRLTYAADNLSNTSQNVSESRSRIQDADYAKASSELARTQIISQAATAVLAQANVDQQTVLKLLNG
jgi:flagellin